MTSCFPTLDGTLGNDDVRNLGRSRGGETADWELGQYECHRTLWPRDLGQATFSGTEVPHEK